MNKFRTAWSIAVWVMLIGALRFTPAHGQSSSIPGESSGGTYYAAFPKSITLDGDFSDWAGIPQASVNTGPQPAPSPADGSLTFAAVADSANLYFSATVTDNNIIAGRHGADYWNEDSVEIYLNTTNNFGLNSYTSGVAQITIPAANIGLPPDQAIISGQNAQNLGIRAIVVPTNSGYALEVAIPLQTSNWSITPSNGLSLGFEVQLNGATQNDRDIKLSWSNKDKAKDLAYQNPSVFGQLTFIQIGDEKGANPPPPVQPTTIPPTNILPTDLPIATLPPPPPTDLPIVPLPTALPTLPPATPTMPGTDWGTVFPDDGMPLTTPSQTLGVPGGVPGQTYNAAFPRSITLDGQTGDWTDIQGVRVVDGPQPPANPDVDGSMRFASVADANNLYFLVAVTDNNIIAGRHGADYWNEDSVEIYLNTTNNFGLTSYTSGVAQITIPAANIGLPPDQTIVSGQNSQNLGIRAVVVKTTTGYRMEVAVPLHTSNWNITPGNGIALGFEIQLNDATMADRDVKLAWSNMSKAQDQAYMNPSVFGQLTFFQIGGIVPTPTTTLPTDLPIATLPPPPVTAVPTTAPPGGGFRVEGSAIIGPDGQPFVARGVNVNGYNWVWQRSTVGDINLIVDCWNFNLVRVNSFLFTGEQPWQQYGDNNDLDAIVNAYTSRHIVVLFEAHDRIGSYYTGSDLDRLVSWFTDLAMRYRNNPYVWFDVSNEPGGRYGIDVNNWLNMHRQVIQAIRDVAQANNIIIVEGATGGQDAGRSGSGMVSPSDSAILQYGRDIISFGGKTYPNIVFSIHPYDLWNYGDAKLANFLDQVRAANLALVIGEYGVQTDQNTTSAASSVINTAPSRGIGRIVWHWDGHDFNDLTAHTLWGGGWEIDNCANPNNLSWLGLSVWIDNHSGR